MVNDKIIFYDEFMKSARINHNNSIETYWEGITDLNNGEYDIISYNTQKNLTLNNVAILEIDKNNNYIYEYTPERVADIIDNIHIKSSIDNVKIKFIIDGKEYDCIDAFINILASYQEFKLKLIFSEPKIDKISICYKNYLLNNDLKKKILTTGNIIKTDTNIYSSGNIQPRFVPTRVSPTGSIFSKYLYYFIKTN